MSRETAAQGRSARDGLSPALLRHAGEGQRYLGFISYRRRDGLALARWLRDELLNFAAPPELAAHLNARDDDVGGRQNRVFLDLSYQKPSVDFWDEHIAASLCRSRTLIFLQTPSVFEPLGPGEPNWCEREIDTFLKFHGDPSRVLVVLGPGAPVDRFPPPLQNISARWDWIDLRFFSTSMAVRQWNRAEYDAQLTKVLAKIYEVEDGDLPLLGRELQRARVTVRRRLGIAAAATFIGLSGLTGWALVERARAVEQRNAALISQSRYLARTADGLVDEGTTRAAIALLREALPDAASGRDRPLVPDAVASAYRAIYANKERGRLPVPPDARLVTSDGKAGLFVFATADKLIVRQGLEAGPERGLAHDFGAPAALVLAPDSAKIALIADDGHLSVRDLETGREIVRHEGFGAGTSVKFVAKAGKALVVAPGGDMLALVDLGQARETARRTLPGEGAPGPLLADDNVIAVVRGEKLVRLSSEDLAEMGSATLGAGRDFALTLVPGREYILAARSQALLEGSFAEVRLSDMAVTRTFGKIVWGVRALSISPDKKVIALAGINGIDFFEPATGERTSHVASNFAVKGGSFFANYYVGYGANGGISRWSPTLGTEVESYMTVGAGEITTIDPLPDGSGFIALSDKPALTHWAFEARMISRKLSVPLIIGGIDFKIDQPLAAYDKRDAGGAMEMVASYIDGSLRRWDLTSGEARLILPAAKAKGEERPALQKLVALAGSTVTVNTQGIAEIVHDDGRVTGHFTLGPLRYSGSLGDTQAVFITEDGAAKRLDVAADEPRLEEIADLAGCQQAMTVPGALVCAMTGGELRLWSPNRSTAFVVPPRQGSTLAAASLSANGRRLAIASRDRHVLVLDAASGAEVMSQTLRGDSASEIEPVRMATSADGELIAQAYSDGAIYITEISSGKSHEIAGARQGVRYAALEFSANGKLVAAIEVSDVAVLVVRNTAGGPRLARISISGEPKPTLYPEPRGRGFVTIDPTGSILIHPAFEEPRDLVEYLKREFPDELTPAQRKRFFID